MYPAPFHLDPLPIRDCAVGSWYFGPFSGSPDAVLPSVDAYGGAAWFNIAPFALVEARQSFAECAGTDRAAPQPLAFFPLRGSCLAVPIAIHKRRAQSFSGIALQLLRLEIGRRVCKRCDCL
jgi:hypothetical protein